MRAGILLVTRNFPPILGGMERLMHHVYLELRNDYQVSVLGPSGCGEFVDPGVTTSGCALSPTARFLACLQWKAYRMAKRLRPNLVIAGSGMAVPAALCAARNIGVPIISFLHGLDLVARNPVYRSLFVPAILRCDGIIANSQNTARLAREAGVKSASIEVLHPGVALPDSSQVTETVSFREKHKIQRKVVLLSVGRIQPRKGLADFVTRVLPILISRGFDVALAIIGSESKHALKSSGGETRRIMEAARSAEVGDRILMLGAMDDAVLAQAYRESDLLVFPVRDIPGDVEGFGMVAVEAAAHGLPTVAFACGGVPDAVKDGVSGYLVRPGDYEGYADAVMRCLEEGSASWRRRCFEHAREFSWQRFGTKLRLICHEATNTSRS